MRRAAALLAVLLGCAAVSAQQEPSAFIPPQAYPADRYEGTWGKNPFTLKTAPAVMENVSFAKDLAIGSHYGNMANPTIVIVNTKTHERFPLRQGDTAPNGMKLVSVKIGASRKDTTAEITLGAETTEVKYNREYLGQVAASKGGAASAAGRAGPGGAGPGGVPNASPMQRGPGMTPGTIRLPATSNMTRPAAGGAPVVGSVRRGAPGGPNVMLGAVPAASAAVAATSSPTGTVNLNVSTGGQAPAAQAPLVSQANPNAPPVPVRRRMISVPVNGQALPQ